MWCVICSCPVEDCPAALVTEGREGISSHMFASQYLDCINICNYYNVIIRQFHRYVETGKVSLNTVFSPLMVRPFFMLLFLFCFIVLAVVFYLLCSP